MANPQKEHGYVTIANELQDALCRVRIPGEVNQIFSVIIRKTYGFNKKKDTISLSQFEEMTKLHHASVVRAIKKAREMKLILVDTSTYITTYSINKNYEEWTTAKKSNNNGSYKNVTSRNSATSRNNATGVVAIKRQELVAIKRHTKDKRQYTKDIAEDKSSATSKELKTKEDTMWKTYEEPTIDADSGEYIPSEQDAKKERDGRLRKKSLEIMKEIEKKYRVQFTKDARLRNTQAKILSDLMGNPDKPKMQPTEILREFGEMLEDPHWVKSEKNPTLFTLRSRIASKVK